MNNVISPLRSYWSVPPFPHSSLHAALQAEKFLIHKGMCFLESFSPTLCIFFSLGLFERDHESSPKQRYFLAEEGKG